MRPLIVLHLDVQLARYFFAGERPVLAEDV
jgi:hypothetical protein